jgi:uncharacterized membrane protein YdjX (TVP38/TMEM64 family)
MKRSVALVAAVAAVVVLSKVLLENVLGIDLGTWARSWVEHAGAFGALTVVTLLAVDVFLPIPSSLVMVLSGAAFGVWWGSLLAFAGSVGGEWLGFELARRYGSGLAARIVGDAEEIQRIDRTLVRHGAAAVVVTRALPVVMETMSVVAGLSTMSRASFLAASTIGTAPIVVIYAYAGAMSRDTGSLVPAIVMLIAVAGCAWVWYRARFS